MTHTDTTPETERDRLEKDFAFWSDWRARLQYLLDEAVVRENEAFDAFKEYDREQAVLDD